MPRKVLKKTLQAKAKRLGIKGFSTMRKEELQKAIERKSGSGTSRKTKKRRSMSSGYGQKRPMFARTKPTRMSKRTSLSDSVEIKFDPRQWLIDTKEELQEWKEDNPGAYPQDYLFELLDTAVIYYRTQREIVFVISGEPNMSMEFRDIDNGLDMIDDMQSLAFHYLQFYTLDNLPSELFEPFYEDE
jgi:hypothetical protein